jgi:hypothetical protein
MAAHCLINRFLLQYIPFQKLSPKKEKPNEVKTNTQIDSYDVTKLWIESFFSNTTISWEEDFIFLNRTEGDKIILECTFALQFFSKTE